MQMQTDQTYLSSDEIARSATENDGDVCRDFLRNVCKRGRKCKYKHRVDSSAREVPREPIFCHDFQNGVCRRSSCKFAHSSLKERESLRICGGTLPHQSSEYEFINADAPACKDFLNHNCHRGSSCKFRHGKSSLNRNASPASIESAPNNPASYHDRDTQSYLTFLSCLPNQHLLNPDSCQTAASAPRTSESPVTTSETTAMVAAAAAAGYLAMRKHGQHHCHGTVLQASSPITQNSALPPASAAAVAAAAAATALATQHHQQHAPLNQIYSETALTAPQSTSIPVMQSILGVVNNSNVLHRSSNDSAYSSSAPSASTSEIAFHCYQGNSGSTSARKSHFCVDRDIQVPSSIDSHLSSLVNHPTKSTNYMNSNVLKNPVNSHATFRQHQQDANRAAAVAAAACFGAILSQPVAAAAAASHAAVSKPTAGDILSKAISGDRTLSSMAPSSCTVVPQPSTSGLTTSAPPSAVAAAAAAAVAAAVVSSAGPSAAVAAISAAHLASSSLSHAHSSTHVSDAPVHTSSVLTAGGRFLTNMKSAAGVDSIGIGSRHRRLCASQDTLMNVYGSDEALSLRLNVSTPPPQPSSVMPSIGAATVDPSSLGSSAATAAYTATMTTAAAAAAMAAAVAVEEHNQKTNAAAAVMAAFNESAALAHGVQSMTRMTDRASSDSLPSSSLAVVTKSSLSEASAIYALPAKKSASQRPLRFPSNRHQARFSALEAVDDESFEESYYEDEEDEGVVMANAALSSNRNDRNKSRIGRSYSPDHTFGRSQPIVDKPRQRSLSYPICTSLSESNMIKERQPKGLACVSSPSSLLLSQRSINSTMAPPLVYHEYGLPLKRPKFVAPHGSDRMVSPNQATCVRRRYHHFPRRLQQIDIESEMDEDEEFCYNEVTGFYSPATVTASSFGGKLHVLKRENARLRLRLQRVIQQRNQLQLENHTLIKQNLKLRKFNSASKNASIYSGNISMKPVVASALSFSTRQQLLHSPSPCPRSSLISNRKKFSELFYKRN